MLLLTTCTKEKLPEFYFRCKVDGRDFKPDNCTNCSRYEVYGDTMISIGGNMGWETVRILCKERIRLTQNFTTSLTTVRTTDRYGVASGFYMAEMIGPLNNNYRTDSVNTGEMFVTSVDRTNRILEGNFYFTAYSPGLNKKVNITDGKFRVRYTPN